MSILVVAEHDNETLASATYNAVAAASQLSGDIEILVAGSGTSGVAEAAAKIPGVAKVLNADSAEYANDIAENTAPLLVQLAPNYSHVLAPATTFGKNVMPRASALLDVQQISEITAIESDDTFVRPIYAGNAMATVQSTDSVKMITVRM
ncbi:MAG: electron transfer flavoprotein subunit alpha/FixB family protein, partial [Rhodospirillales bacterium]|nr:electron transfer flavoprotein subunit alpha/FixB family protein [Rhodospirillales bacterium]